MSDCPTVLWFRSNLRLADHAALVAAVARKRPVVPVYLWSPEDEGDWPPGEASRWWFHRSLISLSQSIEAKGNRLIFLQGPTVETLGRLIAETGADALYFHRRYEPQAARVEARVLNAFAHLDVKRFAGNLLVEPEQLLTRDGQPHRSDAPYREACMALLASEALPKDPLAEPDQIPAPAEFCRSLSVGTLGLLPQTSWYTPLEARWIPGEFSARETLQRFMTAVIPAYAASRDIPFVPGTSSLSPHLHFGEITPQQIIWVIGRQAEQATADRLASGAVFLDDLIRREFAHSLLVHFPKTPGEPFRPEFLDFSASEDDQALDRWRRGETGYPLVDAGMRELWATGWMHNRVRRVVAVFLAKHLLLPWQQGARWFWDTLVDADLACNTLGWQWAAGCGPDAPPYFRSFNPVLQGEKLDPGGEYVRQWLPELAGLAAPQIQRPWLASPSELAQAGIILDKTYPRPIVDPKAARKRILDRWRLLRKSLGQSVSSPST